MLMKGQKRCSGTTDKRLGATLSGYVVCHPRRHAPARRYEQYRRVHLPQLG